MHHLQKQQRLQQQSCVFLQKPGPYLLRGARFKDNYVKDCKGKQPHQTGVVVEPLWQTDTVQQSWTEPCSGQDALVQL